MRFDDLKVKAAYQWPAIHGSLGIIAPSHSHMKHTSCPGCGGKDRFRVTSRYQETGGWICSQGGDTTGGDGFGLIGHALGYSPSDQLKAVAEHLGLAFDASIDKEAAEKRRIEGLKQAEIARKIAAKAASEKTEGAIEKALNYYRDSTPVNGHAYLDAKGLPVAYNLRLSGTRLLMLTHTLAGDVTGAQLIFGEPEEWKDKKWNIGDKFFLAGTQKKGSMHWLDLPPDDDNPIAVCEGWATGASLYEPEINHQGAVAVAFDAGNIPVIVDELLLSYPSHKIVIYADDDKAGRKGANDAAILSDRVSVRLPIWRDKINKTGTDFNDWLIIRRKKG